MNNVSGIGSRSALRPSLALGAGRDRCESGAEIDASRNGSYWDCPARDGIGGRRGRSCSNIAAASDPLGGISNFPCRQNFVPTERVLQQPLLCQVDLAPPEHDGQLITHVPIFFQCHRAFRFKRDQHIYVTNGEKPSRRAEPNSENSRTPCLRQTLQSSPRRPGSCGISFNLHDAHAFVATFRLQSERSRAQAAMGRGLACTAVSSPLRKLPSS
jgi:hypothetical protein